MRKFRFPLAFVIGLGLNAALFGLLRALITGEGEVATLSAPAKIEFTRLKRSGQVEAIKRAKPKVEKPEQKPAAPSLSMEQASSSEARAEVAALASPMGVAGTAGVGGILGGGFGGGAGGGIDRDPVPLVRIEPNYPPQAQSRGIEGWVVVQFTISGAGNVKQATIVQSSDRVFESEALRAIQQWKYQPQLDAGKPVDHEGVQVKLIFKMET